MAVEYEEFIEAVSRAGNLDHTSARQAVQATVTVLARMADLDDSDRQRLLSALPARLRQGPRGKPVPHGWDQAAFVREVAILGHWPAEQARLRAQAVLATLAEREPDLATSLTLPGGVRELFTPPRPGGGITGPAGHLAPLTGEEVAAALRRLPAWQGDTRALRRTIALPPDNLDRVLARIQALARELGGGLHIRRDADSAELIVRSTKADAVTAPDVDIAARIDQLIAEAGAGMSSP